MRFSALALAALSLLVASAAEAQSGSFGNSLVMANGEIIVAEPTNNFRPGTVYVYRPGDDGWIEVDRLQSPNAFRADGFGTLLALADGTLFVGQREGPVHAFTRSGGRWRHSGTLEGTETLGVQRPAEDRSDWGDMLQIPLGCNQLGFCETDFGLSMVAGGDWLFLGEPGLPADDGQDRRFLAAAAAVARSGGGVVHVYRRGEGDRWAPHAVLQPADVAPGDLFGRALALEGGTLMVGAPGRSTPGPNPIDRAGQVYAFTLEGDSWTEAGVVHRGSEANGGAGSSLALSGNRLVIGAPGAEDGRGGAVVVERTAFADGWTEAFRLAAPDGERGDRFGAAVGLSGFDVWVGAPRPRDIETGRAYVFTVEQGATAPAPTAVQHIELEETVQEDAFGGRIFAADGWMAVSALGMHHGAGSVHLFERDGDAGWAERALLVSPPDALEALLGDERHCPEDGGTIGPFDCEDVDLVAFVPIGMLAPGHRARGVRTNDNWGWTDPVTGREYALVGRNDGLAILDLTNPSSPVLVGDLPKTPNTPRSQLWRDVKTYREHAFVVADGAGNHGLQVLDLRRLRDIDPADMPVTFEPDHLYTNVASVHNIHINEETGLASLVGARGGGESCGGGLHMLDVQEPLNPRFLGCLFDELGTHDVQCVIYRGPDEAYRGREICLKANARFLSVSDVTDRDNPVVVGRGEYPTPGYLHQGWLTEDHRHFIMNDEADLIQGHVERTRTLIFDVSDLEDPVLAKEFFGSLPASAHNLYIVGNHVFQANYRYGLQVLDITDPLDPVEVGHFGTAPFLEGPGFSGAWSTYPFFESGLVLVTSLQEGAFLLRPRVRTPVFEEN